MNAKNAHQYLPLIQALADGKKLQIAYTSDPNAWYDAEEINFIWDLSLYRIKPEPRTFDVWINTKTKKVVVVENGDSDKDEIFFEWERITVMEVLK